jgi:hypothetical protein
VIAPDWTRAARLAGDLVEQGLRWQRPGATGSGVDCAEAVRRLLVAAGAELEDSAAWMLAGWEGGREAALERVDDVRLASAWSLVAEEPAEIPFSVRPFDVVLSTADDAPLHVSAVVAPGGRLVLSSMRGRGVCCTPGRDLSQILAIYRLEELHR